MPYLGRSPGSGVRTRFIYAATAGQTSFSGNDSNSVSLAYEDTLYMDVYQNGVLLKPVTDYAATTGTSVVLVTGATTDDVVEMIVYDTFAVADTVSAKDGGTFSGNVAMGGTLNVTGAFTSPGIDDNADAVAITIDSSERVGIGATSPSELLDVYSGSTNARIQVQTNNSSSVPAIEFRNTAAGSQIGMPANVNAMTFTTADNERMRIDSSGRVTMPSQPAFQAVPASNQNNIATGTDVTIIFGTERFDVGSNFASNTFTAPVTGKYYLDVQLRVEYIDTAANYYQLKIQTTNHTYVMTLDPNFSADMLYGPMSISIVADMDANDTTLVKLHQSGGTAQSDIDDESYFSGYLLG